MTNRAQYLFEFLTQEHQVPTATAQSMIEDDLVRNKYKGRPQFSKNTVEKEPQKKSSSGSQRQQRHQAFTTRAQPTE